jgi:hypothetical protein
MGTINQQKKGIFILVLIAIATIIIWQIPYGKYILYPFTILGIWFHEMGHGIAALLLGAGLYEIQIHPEGYGFARHSTDALFGNFGLAFIAAGGPIGPTIAGFLLIISSKGIKAVNIALFLLSLLLVISLIFWIRNFTGILMILAFAGLFIIILTKGKDELRRLTIQFLGIQAFASVYLSIGYLYSNSASIGDSSFMSDTEYMSRYLLLPHWFWASILILFSIFMLYKSLKIAYTYSNGQK